MYQEIHTTVNHYLTSKTDYALMISDKWGCGKTFCINELMKNRANVVHVSLYGIKDPKDIMRLILSNHLAGKLIIEGIWVAKTLSSALFKTEFDKTSSDIMEGKEFKIIKDWIIVLDDLERADVSAISIMGVVNELVSSGNNKVILISNETELIRAQQKVMHIEE